MPGSSVRDPSPASSSSGKKGAKKRKQKLTKASDDPGSKKKDRNAKEPGGVFAVVTRHGATFSNGSTTQEPAAVPQSPPSPAQTPEIKPSRPSSIPVNGAPNAAVSPLLDGVTGTSIATSTAPSMSEWTKNHPALAGSPNLISLMGESPPTQPSSYEDHTASLAWTQHKNLGSTTNYVAAASPPIGARRPLSFQMDNHFPVNDVRSQASSPPGIRRSSMHSPFSQPRAGSNPPLPHQLQPHFHGAPEIDLDLGLKDGLKAGERGYYFGFDTWPVSSSGHSFGGNNVVLAGYEGGLDVYSVSKRGIELLTSLKGLRGGVYNAKILPWSSTGEHEIYPLVAVVVHGPVLPPPAPEVFETRHDATGNPRLDGINTPQSESSQRPVHAGKTVPTIESYQTTVEVYSLRTHKLINTLLQAPKIPIKASVQNPIFRSPAPTGALQVRADNGNIVVASGTTGECWVFRHFIASATQGSEFRCVGKLWTSLQQAIKRDMTAEEERSLSPAPPRQSPQMPIVAVHGRWFAYCPPAPSSQIALNASIGVAIEGRAPGLPTLTSPVLPAETSEVDQPESNGVMNKIMRETTQEVIQGARWVGKQGMQLWNNYWKQPSPQSQSRPQSVGSPPWASPFSNGSEAAQFPPTYGISGQAITKDPGLVSIIDLEGLVKSPSIHHLTTFKVPLGCSFLSFSPTGLSLFTASSKGDVQTVWDLLRIQYSKSSALQSSTVIGTGHSTRVRQIAQFSRMTVARIVDVAWAKPNGERVAMVTERGTVHLLDMPQSAYTWPPPRQRTKANESNSGGGEATPSAVSMASNALTSAYGAARPLISRRRQSSVNTNTTSTLMDHASYGGKVLAAGISHSLGNTATAINQMRQNAENRVSLPMSNQIPGISCIVWVSGRKYPNLFAAGDGLVRTFPSRTRQMGNDKSRIPRGNRYKDFKLRSLPNDVLAPSVRLFIEPEEDMDFTSQDYDGGNTLVLNPRPPADNSDLSPESSIPQAEIETSAPYQPFHTDRRVALFEYSEEVGQASIATVTQLLDLTHLEDTPATSMRKSKKHQQHPSRPSSKTLPWAFGQHIPAARIDTGAPVITVDEDLNSSSIHEHRALPASAMERVMQLGDNDEQIVITTRRRRGGTRVNDAVEDGFFEDDCDVLDFADQRV